MSGGLLTWCMFEFSEENCLDSFQPHRAGEELGQNLLGYLIIVWHDACSCATGGGSRGGGVFGPLGTTDPRGVSPREQGGPWAPPPCSVNSSETLSGLCLLFCSVFWDGCWVFCVVFSVSGVGNMLLGLVPFRTRPLLAKVFVVLSFSLVVWLVSTTPFSLFFLSQVLGKPKPISGLGCPLCLFILATISLFNPHALLRTYIKVTAPRLFFFFFFFAVVARLSGLGVLGLVWMGCVFWWLVFWWWFLACIWRQCIVGRGRRTRHPSPL